MYSLVGCIPRGFHAVDRSVTYLLALGQLFYAARFFRFIVGMREVSVSTFMPEMGRAL